MDPGPNAGAGSKARAIRHRVLRDGDGRPAPSGAGLQNLSRDSGPGQSYDATRLDAACRRGLTIRARSIASIRSILKNGLDRAFIEERPEDRPLRHANIRGQGYYH